LRSILRIRKEGEAIKIIYIGEAALKIFYIGEAAPKITLNKEGV
jgi:hypothetical protein